MTDGPRPSPRPAYPPQQPEEPKTDPRLIATIEKHAPMPSRLKDLVVAIAAVGASVVIALIFVDNRVQAQTDAGVKVHESRISTLEEQRKADRVEMNERLERLEQNQNADHALSLGTSQKLDKLLERFQVPNPAPAPKDGGP